MEHRPALYTFLTSKTKTPLISSYPHMHDETATAHQSGLSFPKKKYDKQTLPQLSLCSRIPQPLPLLFRQLIELFRETRRRGSPLEEIHEEILRLVVALAATASRLFGGKRHELLFCEATA